MENLDMKCVELGQTIAADAKVEEKLLTDALGVLEEQGLYAAFLYLKVRGKDGGEIVSTKTYEFLKETPQAGPLAKDGSDKNDILNAIQTLSKDLDNLLLARDLVRQALVYARYHVKARRR